MILYLKSVCDLLYDILSANKLWIANKKYYEFWLVLSAELQELIEFITLNIFVNFLSKPPKYILFPFAINKRQKDTENS
jgi:hypothetical protein